MSVLRGESRHRSFVARGQLLTLNRHAALLDDVGELALVHEVHFGPRRRLRISAASDGSYPASRKRLAGCRYGQIFCGRPPGPTLLTCEKRAQMRPHPCSRGIGQSASARCPRPPGARARGQREQPDNTRSGSCLLHWRTAATACAVPVPPPSQWRQEKRVVRPACGPTPAPSARLYLGASAEAQSL